LHQVGVSFDLYYDARKHKIKNDTVCLSNRTGDAGISLLTLPEWAQYIVLSTDQETIAAGGGRVWGSALDCCYRRCYWTAIRRDDRLSYWYL
jgi:hypothetical protein